MSSAALRRPITALGGARPLPRPGLRRLDRSCARRPLIQPRLHRRRREHRLHQRHRQLLDAVPQRSGPTVRARDSVLRQHAPVHRQLLHDERRENHHQRRQLCDRQLLAAGKTWKSYAEDLPSVGYTGGDSGNYARKHNVFALLSDVANDPVQQNKLVPFTQFATDLASNALPNYSFIVPNLCNDAHDCSLSTADAWLQTNIDPLIKNAQFQQDGLLIILFDEAAGADTTHGGGRIAWLAVSAKAKPGYQSTTLYQHASTLRLSLKALGVTALPNGAATAPDMDEFFKP